MYGLFAVMASPPKGNPRNPQSSQDTVVSDGRELFGFENPFRNSIPRQNEYSIFKHKSQGERAISIRFGTACNQNTLTTWNPSFLSGKVLVIFGLFFAGMIAGLQAIYSVSQSENGIASSDDSKRYLWTYGPTTVLVLVTVCLRQVDYSAKTVQPWAEMAVRETTADRSLLLDYQSPFQLVAFWRAARNRHWTVAATILLLFLLKITTIVSTALFVLKATLFEAIPAPMVLTSEFPAIATSSFASMDSRPAYMVYGNQAYNVSLRSGTTTKYAAVDFEPAVAYLNASAYSAIVDVFSSDLQCEHGQLIYTNSSDGSQENTPVMSYYNASVSTLDCRVYNATLDAPDWYFIRGDTRPRYGYYASIQQVNCSNLAADDPNRSRLMVATTYSIGTAQRVNNMLNSSNMICSPSYQIQRASVSTDHLGHLKDVQLKDSSTRQIHGLSSSDLALGITQATELATALTYPSGGDLQFDPFVALMAASTANFRPEMLLDPNYLESATRDVYRAIAVQVARTKLLVPSSRPKIDGLVSRSESRLFARETPVRIMQGLAAISIILLSIVYFTKPRGVSPRLVDSIVAVAAILSRSESLIKSFHGTGHMSLDQIRWVLSDQTFRTSINEEDGDQTFSILVSSNSISEVRERPEIREVQWFRPPVLRRTIMCLSLMAPVAGIIALEVLLRRSDQNSGLGTVSPDTEKRYSWLYGPTLIVVLLGTLFDLIDFELQIAEPFHALSKNYCNPRTSILYNSLGMIPVGAAWKALRQSRFALLAASIAVILSPLMTIIVSGLYTALAVPSITETSVVMTDWFNTTGGFVNTQDPLPGLVIEGNMSYPQWTYDEIAVPRIGLVDHPDTPASAMISVNVPAVRGAVSCDPVRQNQIFDTTFEAGYVTSNISTPDGCGNFGSLDSAFIYLTNQFQVPTNAGYFGQSLVIPSNDQCSQKLALYYGHVNNSALESCSTYICSTSLELVNAKVSFDISDYSITHPPIINDSSSSHFSNWSIEELTLQFLNISDTPDILDNLFSAIIYGQDGTPANELVNSTLMINAFTRVYRRYAAQIVNKSFRSSVAAIPGNESSTIPLQPLPAIKTDLNRYRLVQSALSTRLLEAVLGILLVCAVIMLLLLDMRKVLPKSVGSIAAVASLLAGSKMLNDESEKKHFFPIGAEWWTDENWAEKGVWDDVDFRMGWWNAFQEPIESNAVEDQNLSAWKFAGMVNMSDDHDRKETYFGISNQPRKHSQHSPTYVAQLR